MPIKPQWHLTPKPLPYYNPGCGLGIAMSRTLLARPTLCLSTFVRNPSSQQDLDSVAPGVASYLLKIKYDASEPTSAA